MRVLWATHSTLGVGGTLCQTASRGTIGALSNLGWEMVILSKCSEQSSDLNEIDGFDWYHIKSDSIRGTKSIMLEISAKKELKKVLEKYEFDLVIVNWSLCRAVLPITSKRGIPAIVDDRSPPVHEDFVGKLQWIHYRYCWKFAAKNANGFSFNSVALRDMVRERYHLRGPCCVYPSATNPENFSKSKLAGNEPITLVYHGLLDRERDVWSIVEACDIVIKSGIEVNLIIFGHGNDEPRLEKAASDRDWFELLPKCSAEEVPERLANAHIGVIPLPDSYQWRFSSPLKLFEYAASGLNVIATDIQCHRLFGNRSWLKLVRSDNSSEEIAKATIEIATNREKWQIASREAWMEAKKEFTWENSVSSLDSLIRGVLEYN